MLKSVRVKDFKAVAHLEGTALLTLHKGCVKFSSTRPNVIVGPNGAGKSALLDALALRFLAHLTGESTLDDKYVREHDIENAWSCTADWRRDYKFLAGLTVDTDGAPALYYRPGHIPGNEVGITHAMMCGYDQEARGFDKLTRAKSSGQKSQASLAKMVDALTGKSLPTQYKQRGWNYGRDPKELNIGRQWIGPWEYKAEVLKALVGEVKSSAVPLVLMDEPEQSLDSRAEAQLWNAIAGSDPSQVQVIVATHSLFPLLHPSKFNIIEAEKGYCKSVLELMA